MSITKAQQAKADKHLAQFIRSSAYGVTTRGERIRRSLADGCTLEVASVRDEARERAIEREMHMRRNRPFGNECHPETIKYNTLKAELAAGPRTEEYRLQRPDEAYFNILTVTEYRFALEVSK